MHYRGCISISEEQYERLMNIIRPLSDENGVERIIISRKHYDELKEGKPIWNVEYDDIGGRCKIDDDGDLLHVEYKRIEKKLTDEEMNGDDIPVDVSATNSDNADDLVQEELPF